MRKGMKEILLNSLRNPRWLLSQAYKYVAIPFSMKFLKGETIAGPLMGSIFVTYRCNSCCTMCSYPGRARKGELTTEELVALIDDMIRIGTSGIGFTGGEPLLRKDIFKLLAHTRYKGVPVTLNTNGLLLNDDTCLEKLIKSNPTNINISLDGCCGETHDRLRGKAGLFEKTVTGVRMLADRISVTGSAIKITIVTVVSDENFQELDKIADLAKEIGAHRIGFMPLHDYDAGGCSVVKSLKLANISQRIRAITALPLENSGRFIESFDRAVSGRPFPSVCNAGYTSIFVDPYGKIAPCLGYFQMGKWSGDIRRGTTLPDVWQSREYADVRAETSNCRTCYLNCQAELNFLWPSYLLTAIKK